MLELFRLCIGPRSAAGSREVPVVLAMQLLEPLDRLGFQAQLLVDVPFKELLSGRWFRSTGNLERQAEPPSR